MLIGLELQKVLLEQTELYVEKLDFSFLVVNTLNFSVSRTYRAFFDMPSPNSF